MDPRYARLKQLRQRKLDAEHAAFIRARRLFAHAAQQVEALTARRAQAGKRSDALGGEEMRAATAGPISAGDIDSVLERAERRRQALALMQAEIDRARAERDHLHARALEQQKRFLAARKVSEKLDLLVGRLQGEENRLQTRRAESWSDSAIRDHSGGRWTLLQTE